MPATGTTVSNAIGPSPRIVFFAFFSIFLVGCTENKEAYDKAILQVMADQEAAWDRGDIEGYMQGYSDTICFIGRNGLTCGRQEVTENYLEGYPDRAAMGDLIFGITEILPIGNEKAWVTGTWQLGRASDTLSGGFSLLWVREAGAWRIVRDHSY